MLSSKLVERLEQAAVASSGPLTTLTNPSTGVGNDGFDNELNDLILSVDDVLVSNNRRYRVKDMLGQGTFGQVVRCLREDTLEEVAVKVIKNQTAFYHQARVEVGVLQFLNSRGDPDNRHHIVRMRDFFMFRSHLCLVFELLSVNLYELVKHNQFRGLSMTLLRVFTSQILDALSVLRESNIIHCDLKPENVLLKGLDSGEIKVIDFGSACFENRTMYSYIQSRFYRSPEVLLGYPYNVAIDMWSLGCMAAELFLGLPLFPGASEHDLLVRIVDMLGMPPGHVLAKAAHTRKYFGREEEVVSVGGVAMQHTKYRLRSQGEFEAMHSVKAPSGKRYFQHTRLGDIIGAYPFRSGLSDAQLAAERECREAFLDFLLGVLDLDPETRWSPQQALQHPFLTGQRFTGPFQPQSLPQHSARSPLHAGDPAALMYHSPMAAMLATSPEFHAQAHAAAMAAVQAHFSPRGSLLGGAAAQTSVQGIDPAVAAAAAAAAARYNPNLQQQQLPASLSQQQAQAQQLAVSAQALQSMQYGSADPLSGMLGSSQGDTPYGTPQGSLGSMSSACTPRHFLSGYSPLASRRSGLASSYQNTPTRSHLGNSLQDTPGASSYSSFAALAAAAAAAHNGGAGYGGGQGLGGQPVGSLEALRATWNTAVHGPLGGGMYQHGGDLNGLQHAGQLPRLNSMGSGRFCGMLASAAPGSSYRDMLMGPQHMAQAALNNSRRQSLDGPAQQQQQQQQQQDGQLCMGAAADCGGAAAAAQLPYALPGASDYAGAELAAAGAALQDRIAEAAGLCYAPADGADQGGQSLQQSWQSFAQSVQQASAGPGAGTFSNDLLRPAMSLEQQQQQMGAVKPQGPAQAHAQLQAQVQAQQQQQQQQQQLLLLQDALRLQADHRQQIGALPAAPQHGELHGAAPGQAPQQLQANGSSVQQPGLAAQLSPEGHSFMSPSDWDPTYSDDQLLNEEAGPGGAASASERQQQAQQRNASRGCLLPRFADAGGGEAGSYSNSITSPAQPSPQGPYDLPWLRGASGEASTGGCEGLQGLLLPKAQYTSIGFTPAASGRCSNGAAAPHPANGGSSGSHLQEQGAPGGGGALLEAGAWREAAAGKDSGPTAAAQQALSDSARDPGRHLIKLQQQQQGQRPLQQLAHDWR